MQKILTPRHIILKFLEAEDKEIISKVARDLHLVTYKRPFEKKINRKFLIRNYGDKKEVG